MTFTPTDWNFVDSATCAASAKLTVDVKINGHNLDGVQCGPGGGGVIGAAGDPDSGPVSTEQGWKNLGVVLGQPSTLTGSVGVNYKSSYPAKLRATSGRGIASIGIYEPVAWNAYPFPPRPTPLPALVAPQLGLAHALATVRADVPDPEAAEVTMTVVVSHVPARCSWIVQISGS